MKLKNLTKNILNIWLKNLVYYSLSIYINIIYILFTLKLTAEIN